MKIKGIDPTFTHGVGRKSATAVKPEEEAKNAGHNQSQTGTGISADIKIDSSRLPEPARSAPAHAARELIAIQEVAADAESPKNFGQFVAQIAKGEQTSDPVEAFNQEADPVSSATSDEIGS